jgi:hypothetical protein
VSTQGGHHLGLDTINSLSLILLKRLLPTSVKGILFGSARMICNLKATRLLRWIIVDVEIRALVKPVKYRTRTGTLEIVVDIREAVACQRSVSGWH